MKRYTENFRGFLLNESTFRKVSHPGSDYTGIAQKMLKGAFSFTLDLEEEGDELLYSGMPLFLQELMDREIGLVIDWTPLPTFILKGTLMEIEQAVRDSFGQIDQEASDWIISQLSAPLRDEEMRSRN